MKTTKDLVKRVLFAGAVTFGMMGTRDLTPDSWQANAGEKGHVGKTSEGSCGEHGCGEGKCGMKKQKKHGKEGSCGEGKCGVSKQKKHGKEGSCGEGSCG